LAEVDGCITPAAPEGIPEALDKNWSATKNPEGPTPSVAETVLGEVGGIVTRPPAASVAQVPVASVALVWLESSVPRVKLEKFQELSLALTWTLPYAASVATSQF